MLVSEMHSRIHNDNHSIRLRSAYLYRAPITSTNTQLGSYAMKAAFHERHSVCHRQHLTSTKSNRQLRYEGCLSKIAREGFDLLRLDGISRAHISSRFHLGSSDTTAAFHFSSFPTLPHLSLDYDQHSSSDYESSSSTKALHFFNFGSGWVSSPCFDFLRASPHVTDGRE